MGSANGPFPGPDRASAGGPRRATRAAAPPSPEASWTAEIAWENAEGRARFTAIAHADEDGASTVVAASEWLDWPPERDGVRAMADSVAALAARLLDAGWTIDGAGTAWYARRFAWTPVREAPLAVSAAEADGLGAAAVGAHEWPAARPDGADATSPPAAPEGGRDDVGAVWRCEIAWSPRAAFSRFVAIASRPGDDRRRLIARSRPVHRVFRKPDPSRAQDVEAVSELHAAMLAAGWRPAGHGAHWYSARLVWPGPGPPPELASDGSDP
jgi:hypothetical protein